MSTRSRSASNGASSALMDSVSSPGTTSHHNSYGRILPSVVVTAPPWTREETPSPDDERGDPMNGNGAHHESHQWDSASTSSNVTDRPGSRWWQFVRRRDTSFLRENMDSNGDQPRHAGLDNEKVTSDNHAEGTGQAAQDRASMKSSSWLSAPSDRWKRRRGSTGPGANTEDERVQTMTGPNDRDLGDVPEDGIVDLDAPAPSRNPPARRRTHDLHLDLPPQHSGPFTMSHSQTPGWQSPWEPHRFRARTSQFKEMNGIQEAESEPEEKEPKAPKSKFKAFKASFKNFILNHNGTPMLLRIVNLALTTGTLGVAITERRLERDNHAYGIMGASITLVIIFAPLTIVHVLVAVYLEYFSRPLGLWKTSWKLAHTLLETVFICLWSSALGLTFDGYFNSPLTCVPYSETHWYSDLPQPSNPLGQNVDGSVSDKLCNKTVTLIVLIFLGLLAYCSSLFVSLFRIFEKVKYRSIATRNSVQV